jgi:hypothetical protein
MAEVSFPLFMPETPEEKEQWTALRESFSQWGADNHIDQLLELTEISIILCETMRRILTVEELDYHLHAILANTEWRLQNSITQTRPDGVEVPVIVAEDWRGKENGFEQMVDIIYGAAPPDTVPDSWVTDDDTD